MRRRVGTLLISFILTCAISTYGQKKDAPKLFPVRQDGKWGYINSAGQVVIAPQFDDAWDFSDGLAYVRTGGRRGVIDQTGNIVVDLQQVDFAGRFSEGLAPVQTGGQNPRRGFIDNAGKLVIAPQFDAVESFREGLAVVMVERKYGFVDKAGRVVIKPQFEKAYPFHDGLALVIINNKHGFIDRKGKVVIPARYQNAYHFSEGLA
ncbi:MAG TPA: WG repeat-containing protein, partial [Pyrinomonadaceae bacterium]|nr:WG repeat-containing protein [Pyrinomonadaceae bacterium]